jgi:hypothetical protein
MINNKYMDLIKPEYKMAYTIFMDNNLHDFAYASHQPVLIHLLNTISEGDVLELGIGYHSTPIMNLICGKQGRRLLSVETDESWVKTFESYNHEIRYIPSGELIKLTDPLFDKKYSIAFIDVGEALHRQPLIQRVKADYIIVHDTDSVVNRVKDNFNYDFSMFKHVHHFSSCTPMTSVLSNLESINEEILKIFQ